MDQRKQCLAELHIFSEPNAITIMTCGLEKDHDGMHMEQWQGRDGKELLKRVTLWEGDHATK